MRKMEREEWCYKHICFSFYLVKRKNVPRHRRTSGRTNRNVGVETKKDLQ